MWRIALDHYWTSPALTAFRREHDKIQEWHTDLDINLDEGVGNEALLANLSFARAIIMSPSIYNLRTHRVFRLITSCKIKQFGHDSKLSKYQGISDVMSILAPCRESFSHFHLHFECPKVGFRSLQAIHIAILSIITQAFPKLQVFRYSPDLSPDDVHFTTLLVYTVLTSHT